MLNLKIIAPMLGAFLFITSGATAQPPFAPGQPGPRPSYNQNKALVAGKVILSPGEEGGEGISGQGAVITIVTSKSDTLHAVAGEGGNFRIANVPIGKSYVSFSLLGYKEEASWATISPGFNRMVANLKPVSENLKEAVIKADVPPVKVVKDTIIFNAAAVKFNKGERAVDILEQMPGVEVSESGVTVLNEAVTAVYVDGTLLFGDSPMKALNNLAAEEVVTIKSFQEYANKDPKHKISKNESMQRVLDVATKSHPKYVFNGDFLAGGGFDTDSTYHKPRYSAGATVGAFSEGLHAVGSFNINNINNASNTRRGNSFRGAKGNGDSADLRHIDGSLFVRKRWMSPDVRNFELASLSGSYNYNNEYTVNESRSEQIYFPSQQFKTREVHKTSYSDETDKSHNFSLGFTKNIGDGAIYLNGSYRLQKITTNSKGSNFNYQDDLSPQGTISSQHSDNTGRGGTVNLNIDKGFFNKLRLSLSSNMSVSKNGTPKVKEDETTSSATTKVLNIDTNTDSRSMEVSPSVRYEISDNTSATVNYSYSLSKSESIAMAMDVSDPISPIIDTVNTHEIYTNNNKHLVAAGFSNHFDRIGANLHVRANYSSTGINRDDRFPEPDPYDKRFNALGGSIDLQTESMINRWAVRYNTGSSVPGVNQIRPKINNNNLYSVSAGNPNLKQSRSHKLSLSYSTVLGAESKELVRSQEEGNKDSGMDSERMMRHFNRQQKNAGLSTFSVSFSFNLVQNPIVSQQIYYGEETYLPEYDYTMPAQSTFTTYVNSNSSKSADGSIKYSTPLNFMKCILGASAEASWSKKPSYVNYTLTNTENFKPSVSLGLRTNFSRNIRINLNTRASYVYSYNDQNNYTKYWVERINVGFELNNILKHIYAGGNYLKTFTQGLSYGKINDNIMNLNAGFRWGPKNDFDLSLAVHDLFNKTTGFSTSMNANYISNNWSHNFGRYVFFTFAYRFNSMQGSGSGRGFDRGPGSGFGPSSGPGPDRNPR